MASKKKKSLLPWLIAAMLLSVVAFFGWSISYSPLWLFTRYKRLRPLIIAQAKFETDNFKSNLYWRAWNCFGMKIPIIRKSLRVGSSNGYSKYLFPMLSLADYFLYLRNFNWTKQTIDSILIQNGGFASKDIQAYNFAFMLKSQGYFETSVELYSQGLIKYLK